MPFVPETPQQTANRHAREKKEEEEMMSGVYAKTANKVAANQKARNAMNTREVVKKLTEEQKEQAKNLEKKLAPRGKPTKFRKTRKASRKNRKTRRRRY